MTAFKVKLSNPVKSGGTHANVTVFAGPDADHLAHCGQLTFRADEAEDFAELLRAGSFWLQRDAAEDGEVSDVSVVIECDVRKLAGPRAPQHEDEW